MGAVTEARISRVRLECLILCGFVNDEILAGDNVVKKSINSELIKGIGVRRRSI